MFTMAITKEHIQFFVHFAFHLKKNAAEATAMICAAYGENAVSHATSFYRQGIRKLPKIWQKVVDTNGEYFAD
ncbi:hypothetical protein ALC60_09804 [Trachymyrmex zeteki]|uniref:Mos1 transposase HTH domain-containing protein n=1 Tax=Mycetomoellerius zeteki TaxID=64791 RepID=A0A151WTE0_9HYME|nr:hypothetical protein ALC60_09804 [Trachymyrmex zeteki]